MKLHQAIHPDVKAESLETGLEHILRWEDDGGPVFESAATSTNEGTKPKKPGWIAHMTTLGEKKSFRTQSEKETPNE